MFQRITQCFDCIFIGCHCTQYAVIPVPILPGLETTIGNHAEADLLDVSLWLPRRDDFTITDPRIDQYRTVFRPAENRAYEYTIVYQNQVHCGMIIQGTANRCTGVRHDLQLYKQNDRISPQRKHRVVERVPPLHKVRL